MLLQVALVAPRDSVTEALAARLGGSPRVGVCRRAVPAALGGADTVVYRPKPGRVGPDLEEARALFAACREARVARVVVVSSAAVHEASHYHPGMLPEVRPLPLRTGSRLARAWAGLEEMAVELLGGTAVRLVVLRPAPVAASDAPDPLARLLARRFAAVPAGFDPTVQLLGREDFAEAVARVVEAELVEPEGGPAKVSEAAGESFRVESEGGAESRFPVYNVAPAGGVPLRVALRLAGARRVPVPGIVQRAVWKVMGKPADEVALAAHRITVAGERIGREMGFAPRQTSAQAVAAAFGRSAAAEPHGPAPAVHDEFGMDLDYIARYGRHLFRFLHDWYWRVEVQGLELVPREGAAVLTGVHRGFQPWDGVMALYLLSRELGRYPRFLVHPCLLKFPFLANYMTKLGGIVACRENADRVLGAGGMAGMFPEGINGAFAMYREVYKLRRFGRDEFVKMALRNRAPIVPFATVGSAEIYPILGKVNWAWLNRLTEWPFLPITPTFPLLPVPLPSKWHTLFLEPLHVEQAYGPEAAEDPKVVRAVSREVRARLEAALAGMLARRRSIFFGSVFEGTAARPPSPPAPAGSR